MGQQRGKPRRLAADNAGISACGRCCYLLLCSVGHSFVRSLMIAG